MRQHWRFKLNKGRKKYGRFKKDEVVRAVKALQISDVQGAVAAGWLNNELIGDRIIVPPARDEITAQKRLEEFECYDLWFCHKPIEK